jgi:hypothetical protein
MFLMDRWASDGLRPEQAWVAHLQVGDLLTITGAETPEAGLESLRSLSRLISLKVRPLGNGFTRVEWPKFAETQQLGVRTTPGERPVSARSTPGQRPVSAPPNLTSPDLSSQRIEKNSKIEKNTHKPPDGGVAGSDRKASLSRIWTLGIEAAAVYRASASTWKLTEARRKHVRALFLEHTAEGEEVLARVVHGYRFARRAWEDVDEHFEADTLLRASNRAKYLEAFHEALAKGLAPPFAREGRGGPAPAVETEEERATKFAAAEQDRLRLLREGKIGQGLRR